MAPTSPSPGQVPVRASSSRKRKPPRRFADEPLAVVTKRPRGKGTSACGKKKANPSKAKPRKSRAPPPTKTKHAEEDGVCADEPADEEELAALWEDDDEEDLAVLGEGMQSAAPRRRVAQPTRARDVVAGDGEEETEQELVGEPFPDDEARSKWPKRYQRARPRRKDGDVKARRHYRSAMVNGAVYALDDDVYVTAPENEADYIGRITEFFEATDMCKYFTCRWFFRPEDTVISETKFVDDHQHDPKRVFLSNVKNDNVLGCIISKVKIIYLDPNMNPEAKAQLVAGTELYYDMSYTVAYSTFACIPSGSDNNDGSRIFSDGDSGSGTPVRTASLLDLYSGCGGMSTGLCLGAALDGLKLETRWAVDEDQFACKSIKYNHPRTEVRHEKAGDFLSLLKEWSVLYNTYVHSNDFDAASTVEAEHENGKTLGKDECVVHKILKIRYGGSGRENGIYFKVQWKGYRTEKDTSWEPIENLSDCPLKIKEFVQEGHKRNILPLPGQVDVICGGPPCQGISGLNRNRNVDAPLEDERNYQIVTFMDIVSYLQPKFILMENVVDILKFAGGYLGRYALSRLVSLNYQARLGMMVAGCYGLPQFRMRVFLWGALSAMVLPKYPLPTHDVIVRGGAPNAFSESIVAYDAIQKPTLKKALLLCDAIKDLPNVDNNQPREVIEYGAQPDTEFQCYIRLSRKDMLDSSFHDDCCPEEGRLLDHQPLELNQDDHERVLQIPMEKGANFRDLTGVMVLEDNTAKFDPKVKRVYLKSGKPLVPEYAMTFKEGKSSKYKQVGNAVAVPVARALGYSLGRAYRGQLDGSDPLFVLPESFTKVGQRCLISKKKSFTNVRQSEVVEH